MRRRDRRPIVRSATPKRRSHIAREQFRRLDAAAVFTTTTAVHCSRETVIDRRDSAGNSALHRDFRAQTRTPGDREKSFLMSILVPSVIVLLYNMVLTTTSKPTFLPLSLFDYLFYY